MTLIYAGIGSRKTPPEILQGMYRVAQVLASRGYSVRSGGAEGADSAFEEGADSVGGVKEMWLPWSGFQARRQGHYPQEPHFTLAATLHPAWTRLSQGAQRLHARNTGQILGADLNTPVRFVVCWTPDGAQAEGEISRVTGGTGTAIRLACRYAIPVLNLQRPDAVQRLRALITS
jgi:hypothetical protein